MIKSIKVSIKRRGGGGSNCHIAVLRFLNYAFLKPHEYFLVTYLILMSTLKPLIIKK